MPSNETPAILEPAPTEHHQIESAVYQLWKAEGHHIEEYLCEFLGTALFVLGLLGAIVLFWAKGSPIAHQIPLVPVRFYLTGLTVGLVLLGISLSPLGRLSGAHVNPAISFGFYVLGKQKRRDMLGYVIAQLLGAVVGMYVGQRLFGSVAGQVQYAALQPGPQITPLFALLAEIAGTFVLAGAIFFFVSKRSLACWTPFMIVLLLPLLVLATGSISGCGLNPARWLGSAFAAHVWTLAWVYSIGPMIGVTMAAGAFRLKPNAKLRVATGKLFHDPNYRSLFHFDHLPSRFHGIFHHPR